MSQIFVTTGDIAQPYEILGPVYFQVSNKGLLSSALDRLMSYYSAEIHNMKSSGRMSESRADWGFLYGEWSVGQSQFEAAFFIATEELKKRAGMVGADAVIGMRQDIDMDTNGFAYFYLQMYGTAVKLKKQLTLAEQYDQAEELMENGAFSEAESIYFRLGGFRDSAEKARAAYEADLAARYDSAEKLMLEKKYAEAKQMYAGLRSYRDAREKAAQAQEADAQWKESLYASRKTAAAPQSGSRSWICPACGKENVFFASKCSCGAGR